MLGLLGQRFRLLRGERPDPRHRTLTDTMRWSYDLLEPVDRELFGRLSVFRGGCDLAAAAAVAGPRGADELDVLDVLDRLVARSMVVADVRHGPTRYGTIETIREFAADQLAPPDAAATAARHADHYLGRAEWAADARLGTDPEPARAAPSKSSGTTCAAPSSGAPGATTSSGPSGSCSPSTPTPTRPDASRPTRGASGCCTCPASTAIRHGRRSRRVWSTSVGAPAISPARTTCTATLTARDEAAGVVRYRTLTARFSTAWSHGRVLDAAALIPGLELAAAADTRPEAAPVVGYFRVLVGLTANVGDPLAAAEEAFEAARRSQRPNDLALANLGLLAADVRAGDGARRGELFDEVVRWSAVVGNRVLPNNAALWMIERHNDEPDVTLSFARRTLVAAREQEIWSTIDVTLRRIVSALVAVGRTHAAATVIGGLEMIESQLFDDQPPVEAIESTLRAALGPELERCRRAGRAMSRTELVDMVLAETDAALASPASPP